MQLFELKVAFLEVKQLTVFPFVFADVSSSVLFKVLDSCYYDGSSFYFASLDHCENRVVCKSQSLDESVFIEHVNSMPVVDQIIVQTYTVEFSETRLVLNCPYFVFGQP